MCMRRLWRMLTTARIQYLYLVLLLLLVLYTLTRDERYPYTSFQKKEDPGLVGSLYDLTAAHNYTQYNASKYCNLADISKPYNADFNCILTSTRPSVTVCIYDIFRDMYISHDLQETGVWEPHVLRDFQEVLERNSDIGVLDLGANIGFYTLLAAQMGHQVVAVEPFAESIHRIYKAAQIGGLYNKITVVHNAIADRRQQSTLRPSGDNQGDTRIKLGYEPCIGSCPTTINTILMDDLLEVAANFTSAVIKMDIQGYEHRAFRNASLLINKINVMYIFIEWIVMKEFYVSANHTSEDKTFTEEMLRMLFFQQFRPYALTSSGGHALNPATWWQWPDDVVWRRLPNDLKRKEILSNHFFNWPP